MYVCMHVICMYVSSCMFLFIYILGVRSLANASRARQFNSPKPPWGGVGTASSNKYGSRGRSCVVGHAWSCVVVPGRAWSVVRGRSCVVVRGRACVVGHSWSCTVGRAWSCRSASFAASTAVARTNEQHLITHYKPPWGGVGQFVLFV